MKLLTTKLEKKTQINGLKGENGQVYRKNVDIANRLNKHFNTIGNKLAKKINPTSQNETNIPEAPENSIYMFETNNEEIRKLIHMLKNNKPPGLDGISNYIIKVSAVYVIPVLVKVFNCCMNIGFFS